VKALRSAYDREMFDPGVVWLSANQFYSARKGLVSAIREVAPAIAGRTLNVGCSQKPYRYKNTVTNNDYLNLLTTLILMAPLNIAGELLGRLLPTNEDLYLDNVVLARKATS
jgi:hypothetical protein